MLLLILEQLTLDVELGSYGDAHSAALLLLNYPVYRNCHILFNSEDRPLDAFPTPQPQQPAIKQTAKVGY
jgi:hypothetical protein